MSWYKESKLSNLSTDPNQYAEPIICSSCNRWQTKDNQGNIVWKYYYNMTQEEQAEMNQVKSLFNTGHARHKIEKCPDCKSRMSVHNF